MKQFILLIFLVGILSGCATTKKSTAAGHLEMRMAHAENRLEEQDRDISNLKSYIVELESNIQKLTSSPRSTEKILKKAKRSSTNTKNSAQEDVLRVSVEPQDVQIALQNAGYYQGAIDGKLGSGSRKAIKTFQKDHDLKSDGVIGNKTWAELKNYLD